MRHDRNSCLQAGRAPAFSDQEADEHAERGRRMFDCSPSSLLGALQNELAQERCIKPARIVSRTIEQIPKRDIIVVQGQISGATQRPHPVMKCPEQIRILRRRRGWTGDLESPRTDVSHEQACTAPHSNPVPMAVAWTSASTQVLTKAKHHRRRCCMDAADGR